jgi:hypothetical protein
MALDPRAVQIHTDGSAYRNPGHVSGCAVVVRYPEHLNREDEVIVGKRVDELSKAAATRGGIDSDTGYKPGAYCRSMVRGGVALPYPASGQVAVRRKARVATQTLNALAGANGARTGLPS